MRVNIVHDYLNQMGGAERVVLEMHRIFPQAPIYTSIYDRRKMVDFNRLDIKTSFMQHLPLIFRFFKLYLPVYPFAFESMRIPECDVLLSSSSAFAKLVRAPKGARHICYCHTPARFLWMYEMYMQREKFPFPLNQWLPLLLGPMKKWDIASLNRVDFFIANSKNVQERIKRFYQRDAEVIYPPIDTDYYQPDDNSADYFLLVSRLNTYKRIDIVVDAFNQLKLPLKIIGAGPDMEQLRLRSADNIEFLGRLPDEALKKHYAACRALIFPGEEDFGMIPLEAMSCGRPVVAYKAGGALETVVEGENGVFFAEQKPESLVEALQQFRNISFNKDAIRRHAQKFDQTVFRKKLMDFISEKV